MKTTKVINRRSFIKFLLLAGSGGFMALWYALGQKNRSLTAKPATIRIDTGKLGNGIYFYDDFIVSVKDKQVRFFSSSCTHAGCRLSREIAGELVCQCHGSRFDPSTGKVLRGPAIKPLKAMSYRHDPKTGETVVKV